MKTFNKFFEISSILKEDISQLRFVAEDVLVSEDQKIKRKSDLQKAMVLGNNDASKSKIVFATNEGLKKVETTIWALDEDDVILKSGINIPLHAICHVALL